MSGTLNIRFAHDMPGAVVEVVGPDMATVGRLWISPGQSKQMGVPSEDSFLRVHLASGEIVNLYDPGNLDREINLGSVLANVAPNPETNVSFPQAIRFTPLNATADVPSERARIVLQSPDHGVVPAVVDQPEARFEAPVSSQGYDLEMSTARVKVNVRLPGSLRRLVVGIEGGFKVRIKTTSPIADALHGYLHRGDLHSAAAMAEWVEQADDLLMGKAANPYGAAAGAYLLLRLRRFDLMHDWPRNLANYSEEMPDGAIIWAWQQMYRRGSEAEMRDYLGRALRHELLPIFSEGLRLLQEGVSQLWPSELEMLNRKAGIVLWNSPFTATMQVDENAPRMNLDVDYEADI